MSNPLITLRTALQSCYPAGEASAIARMVLTDSFGISPMDIYMGKDIHLSENDEQKLENIILRLQKYEPVQYVLGHTTFCGLRFQVNPNVLIPRPETAELVNLLLEEHPLPPHRVLDIGTGSGCIPITLSHHWPESHIEGWDISSEALEVARKNNEAMRTHVRFHQRDILNPEKSPIPAEGGFDLIVSNPPYIKDSERTQMERNVLDWEPETALFVPDNDPLLFYRTIVTRAAEGLLNRGGHLYFETNRAHATETARLMEEAGFTKVRLLQDFYGNDRMVTGYFLGSTKK